MRRITVEERRARLGVRHALADGHGAKTVVDSARAVVGLHSTDPASTFLAALARTPGASIDDVEHALYDDRSLVRVLAMRRTLFAVPREHVGIVLVGAGADIGRQQRTLLKKMLVESEVTDDPDPWIERAEAAALAAMKGAGEIISTELAAADPLLGTRIEVAPGTKYATSVSIASRMLTLLSAEGEVVRTRPRGGWTSTQFRWTTLDAWIGDVERPDTATASSDVAKAWLAVLRARLARRPAVVDGLDQDTHQGRARDARHRRGRPRRHTRSAPRLRCRPGAGARPVGRPAPGARPVGDGMEAPRLLPRAAPLSCSTTSTATPGPPSGSTDAWPVAGPSATTARWR